MSAGLASMQEDADMSRKCFYRKTIDCRFAEPTEDVYRLCRLCLAGQQIDSIELLTSAIMERRIDKLEDEMSEPE